MGRFFGVVGRGSRGSQLVDPFAGQVERSVTPAAGTVRLAATDGRVGVRLGRCAQRTGVPHRFGLLVARGEPRIVQLSRIVCRIPGAAFLSVLTDGEKS